MKGPNSGSLVVVLLSSCFLLAGEGTDGVAEAARKKLPRAIQTRSDDAVKECLETLINAGGKENIQFLLRILPKIPPTEDALYWTLIRGACSFRDRPAMEHLGSAILKARSSGISRDLIFGLAKNRASSAVYALAPVLEKGDPDLQLMAAEKLGTILHPLSVDVLIEAMNRVAGEPSDLRDMILDSLRATTGQDFKYSAVNWEGWWKKNRDRPLEGRKSSKSLRITGTVVDGLKGKRAEKFLGLEKISKKAVIVLSAEYPERDVNNDHLDRVLDAMGVPYTVVPRKDFEKYSLRGVGAILINCAQFHEFCICPTCKPSGGTKNRLRTCSGCNKHIKFSAKLSATCIKKLQAFVKVGGYLFCEDWIVKEVVERAFPRFVTAGETLREGVVDVVPARGRAGHHLLQGIFRPEGVEKKDDWGLSEDEKGLLGGDEGDFEVGEDELEGADEGNGGGGSKGDVEKKKKEKEGNNGKARGEKKGKDDEIELQGLDEDPDGLKKKPGEGGGTVAVPGEGEDTGGKAELVDVQHKWVIDDESWAFKVEDESKVITLLRSGKLQKDANGQGTVACCFWPYGRSAGQSRRRSPGMVMLVLSHFGHQESEADEYTLQNLLLNFLLDANVAQTAGELPVRKKRS